MVELIDTQEVARRLNVSEQWVYERVRRNQIPFYRFGKYLRFNWKEIWEWAEGLRQRPPGKSRDIFPFISRVRIPDG